MAGTLILTHGLPASGKSTWAQQMVDADKKNTCRVNRDDLRTALFGEEYHKGEPNGDCEDQVTTVQMGIITKALSLGMTVIVDDTNLNPSRFKPLADLARKFDAGIRQQYFNISVDECKRRNSARGEAGGRLVPEFVIDNMAAHAYLDDGNLKRFFVSA